MHCSMILHDSHIRWTSTHSRSYESPCCPIGHVELHLAVLLVGLVLARVHRDAARVQHRARAAVRDRRLGRQDPDALRPRVDDLVAHDEVLEVAELLADLLEDLGRLLEEPARQVVLQPADAGRTSGASARRSRTP